MDNSNQTIRVEYKEEIEIWNAAIEACKRKLMEGYILIDNVTVNLDITTARLWLAAKSLDEVKRKGTMKNETNQV